MTTHPILAYPVAKIGDETGPLSPSGPCTIDPHTVHSHTLRPLIFSP
jgi:hypothetical protein